VQTHSSTEIVAIASGKGGSGKTLIAASLGYALVVSGLRVLLVDADPATDGLSLFLLGPNGMKPIRSFTPDNTFTGVLQGFKNTGHIECKPRDIYRLASDDHGTTYKAVISGKGLYGSIEDEMRVQAVPDLDQPTFRDAVCRLFSELRAGAQFDYVLVDTRGGFAFESSDICAAADSFIVVTEPDYTSFYQDRTLMQRISTAAHEMERKPLLKGIIVNKVAAEEVTAAKGFQLELEKEFGVRFQDTYQVTLDVEAIKAYQVQKLTYVTEKGKASRFSYDTLTAFALILDTVVSQWDPDRVKDWNRFSDSIKAEINKHNEKIADVEANARKQAEEDGKMRIENEVLRRERSTAEERGRERELALERETKMMLREFEGKLEVEKERRSYVEKGRKESTRWFVAVTITTAVFCAVLGMFLINANYKVQNLSQEVLLSKVKISELSEQLHRLESSQRSSKSATGEGLPSVAATASPANQ
jgi:cellulose biosynthesis protein BcsQ